eukprot:COSAG05_NODE_2902_length_2524_cov_18.184903_2_plen_79_part_00
MHLTRVLCVVHRAQDARAHSSYAAQREMEAASMAPRPATESQNAPQPGQGGLPTLQGMQASANLGRDGMDSAGSWGCA